MDIFFQDPHEKRLPPEEVRIRVLKAVPWPDGLKVHISIELDPFQKRPNLELTIANPDQQEIATTSIIQSMVRKMDLTMHLRGNPPPGKYSLSAILFYSEEPAEESGSKEVENELPMGKPKITDRAETTFEIPPQDI